MRNGIYTEESSYIRDNIKEGSIEPPITTNISPMILKKELKLKFIKHLGIFCYFLKKLRRPVSFKRVSVEDKSLSRLNNITLSFSSILVSPSGIIT